MSLKTRKSKRIKVKFDYKKIIEAITIFNALMDLPDAIKKVLEIFGN
jgi:hypothetical protein